MWSFTQLFLFFAIYSVIGWVFESVFCTIFVDKKWVNRGFLAGPVCPIYGVGAVAVLLVTYHFLNSPWLVFLSALALTSVLEYFTSWLLEALFNMRWWDYSHCRFNIKGRVCLKNALAFGVMGWLVAYLLHPRIQSLTDRLSPGTERVLVTAVVVLMGCDLLHTVGAINAVSERMNSMKAYFAELERTNEEYTWYDKRDMDGSLRRLRAICEEEQDNEIAVRILKHVDALIGSRDRSLRVLRNVRSRSESAQQTLESLREHWEEHGQKLAARWKALLGNAWQGVKSALGQLRPSRQGISGYKLVMLFSMCSLIGYAIEMLYWFVGTGTVESRQGLLYGPFNHIYGFGAVLMVLVLGPLNKKNDRWLFFAGAVLGGAFEYFCSWVQEMVFGSVSWDYEHQRYSIGGRTSLKYVFFWGVLAVVFIKLIYPRLSRLIDRIPKKQTAFFSVVLAVFFCVNMALSALAVGRWMQRSSGVPAESALAAFLDERYPDERMQAVYPNMTPV